MVDVVVGVVEVVSVVGHVHGCCVVHAVGPVDDVDPVDDVGPCVEGETVDPSLLQTLNQSTHRPR